MHVRSKAHGAYIVWFHGIGGETKHFEMKITSDREPDYELRKLPELVGSSRQIPYHGNCRELLSILNLPRSYTTTYFVNLRKEIWKYKTKMNTN